MRLFIFMQTLILLQKCCLVESSTPNNATNLTKDNNNVTNTAKDKSNVTSTTKDKNNATVVNATTVKRRSRVQKLRPPFNITTTEFFEAENQTHNVQKQNIAYYYPRKEIYKEQNETDRTGDKKNNFENAQKKVEVKAKTLETNKGMSAIVVIGNRTHRVSGPVVKELLTELQKQNEDEEKSKKNEAGQVGQSGSSNLRRIYAANEVAEINRLLGKPLTDAKALGLIKNLLLDRVHTHLAKTMETNQIFDPSQPDLPNNANANAMSKDALHPVPATTTGEESTTRDTCQDQDPKEKCLYLKDLGLCVEFNHHPYIQRRCADTCNLCPEQQTEAYVTQPTLPPATTVPLPPMESTGPPCVQECTHEAACQPCPVPESPVPVPAPQIAAPPAAAILPQILPTTPQPCPASCGALELPPIAIQPCPTFCPTRRRFTTPMPIVFRRTTPRPLVLLADNTPLPHLHFPVVAPTMPAPHFMSEAIECTEHIDLVAIPHHRPTLRPSLCVPVLKPTSLCSALHLTTLCPPRPTALTMCGHVFGRRTTMCPPIRPTIETIELHTSLQPTAMPIMHPTTLLPVVHHRTTMLPLMHPHTTLMPLLPTPAPLSLPLPLAGGIPMGGLSPLNNKCNLAMDIGLAVDSSAAVVPHWYQVQQFLKQLVDRFQMNGVSRIGLIQFDTIAKMPVRLDSYSDPVQLKHHIMKLQPDPYGKRRTDAALEMAKDKFFTQGRSGIPKVLFVLEHGKINGGDPSINWSQMLVEPAQRLKDMGVHVIAVGTTPIATEEELRTLTSSDRSHIVPLQSYGQLPGAVPQIARKACQIAGPSSPSALANVLSDDCSSSCEACERCSKTSEKTPADAPLNTPVTKDEVEHGPYGCAVNYAKLGCYNDDQNSPRPLPEEILNDRGKEFENYSGKQIDYDNWEKYAPDFVCRCGLEAKKRGYKVFGVQFFASCWSGQNGDQTYMEDGEGDPELCISNSKDFRKCQATDQVCIGKQETNFVYTLDTAAKRSEISRLGKG